jgi:hypothetical protein
MQAIELKSKHRVCKNLEGCSAALVASTAPRSLVWQHKVTDFTGQPYLVIPSPDSLLTSRFPSVIIRHEITAGLAYKQFGLMISQPVLKNKWGSEVVVVQAKGKGVFENGKVGISRDFNESQVCQASMTSSQPRNVIASSKLNRMQITANDPNWRFPSNTTP